MAPTDKILHLTRHAEAAHNVDQDYSIPDAQLTAQGCEQAAKLNSVTVQTIQQTADLLVTSPLSRALQTTILGFPALKARLESQKDSKPLIVLSQLQEVDGFPCDVGRHKEELQADPQFKGIDFSNLEIDWNGKQGDFSPANVKSRALWVRRWLRSRPEKEIVVVSHHDMLRSIAGLPPYSGFWENAEVRQYTFANDDDEEAKIIPCSEYFQRKIV